MAITVTITSAFTLKCVEQLDDDSAAAANQRVTHDAFNVADTRNAASTPAAQRVAFFTVTLSAGAATVDLTALTTTNGSTFDATGYKLLEILITNANANAVVIGTGASNGYAASNLPFSSTGQKIAPQGANDGVGALHLYFGDGCPVVSGTVKTLDFAGTGTDAFSVGMLFGDV